MGPDEADFGLVMPFVAVASKGGPYDDNAYTAGYEAGLLDARLHYQKPELLPLTVHSANLPQIDLIAMRRGYTVKEGPADDEWAMIDLRREGGPA